MKRKFIYILLTMIWIIVIFIFSSMNTQESNNKSKQIIKIAIEKITKISESIGVAENKITPQKINSIVNKLNLPLRKCAHATEYAILAILIIFTMNAFTNKNHLIKKILIAILICFLYSLTDEYHQSFVPGRTRLFTDCLIDTTGSVIGCIIYSVVRIVKDKVYKE